MMVNIVLDRGLFVDKLRFYCKILELPPFLGPNDFSTFFNQYEIGLGSFGIFNMFLIVTLRTKTAC